MATSRLAERAGGPQHWDLGVLPAAHYGTPHMTQALRAEGRAIYLGTQVDSGSWPLIAGLASAILAAGITAAALTLFSHGGASNGARGTATRAANLSHATAGSRPTATPRSPASTRTSPPPNPAACLVGTWKSVHQDVTNNINGEPVQFNGGGETGIFRANGTSETDWGDGTVFSANVNGVEWTDTVVGTTTEHWAVQNGEILSSDISPHGTITLRENGVYNTQAPLGVAPETTQYICSGNTLREYFSNGSAELVRQTPSSRR